jgi:hypothetical protein
MVKHVNYTTPASFFSTEISVSPFCLPTLTHKRENLEIMQKMKGKKLVYYDIPVKETIP